MLSKENNEVITNTDRGTPMGELFRRFWLPVALASEIAGRDSVPVRVRVMGEDLIAFRDTNGNVGLLNAYCAHRGAPLFFARNAECGLRCVYHGWKYDVDGGCVDIPNAPEGDTYKEKIHITSYPCVEKGDLIWAYMGPPEKKPPFPQFPWIDMPSSHRYVAKSRHECNYLQSMEGDFDPSHLRFLHSTLDDRGRPNLAGDERGPGNGSSASANMARYAESDVEWEPFPREVGKRRVTQPWNDRMEDSENGVNVVSVRRTAEGRYSAVVGVRALMLPIFCTTGAAASPDTYASNMRIPIDNNSMMNYRLRWRYDPIPEWELAEYRSGGYYFPELIPGTYVPTANVQNDYNVDRIAQRAFSYTGIKSFPLQDIAMMENQWGPVADRTQEHLTSWDEQIIYVRQRLLNAARALANGVEPEEPWHPEAYGDHRAVAVGDTAEEALAIARAKSKERR